MSSPSKFLHSFASVFGPYILNNSIAIIITAAAISIMCTFFSSIFMSKWLWFKVFSIFIRNLFKWLSFLCIISSSLIEARLGLFGSELHCIYGRNKIFSEDCEHRS